ncbi:MAG TPA: hypothetical protein VF290_20745 [Pyrinomonadaceae bacterium]
MRRYLFLPFFLLIFLLSMQTAEACSCGGKPTVLEDFNESDVVVVATAVSVEKAETEKAAAPGEMSDEEDDIHRIKSTSMRVEQVFKGTLKVGEEMIFAQGGGADCIWTFNEEVIGEKFLFYLRRFKDSTEWVADSCGRSRHIDYAGDDLLYLTNLNKVRNKTRISGTLRFDDDGNETLAGRKIRITGGKRNVELKTDENGVYEVYDLPAGRYFIEPEIPKGWKVNEYLVNHSLSVDRNAKGGSLQKIPIILEANKHAGLDIVFDIDNAVRGRIIDPLGQPMNGVCLDLIPADGTEGKYLADCTEKNGAFEIDEIPPGGYVIVVNNDGKMTSSEPFGTFYYPKARKREDATVFNIGIGDIVENLEIYPPIELKTITVEGVLLYSDGKPVADESVAFKSARKQPAGNEEDDQLEEILVDASAKTDRKGRFSIRIMQGTDGSVFGWMYSYVGQFENCPKLDRLIKQAGSSVPQIKTPAVEIRAATNVYGVELKFPFPSCKKAPTRN